MAENVHVAGLCDKAEDAAVLLVKWPHVRRFHTVRGSEFAGERLLRDLGQIAEAIPTRLPSAPSAPRPRRERTAHKKSTLSTTPSPATARYTHWTVLSVVAFFPLKKYEDAMSGPAKEAMPWKPWLMLSRIAA
jgi:hypothetical protein